MTFADTVYAVWALAVAAAIVLWLGAVRGRRLRGTVVGHPAAILRGVLANRWVRLVVVLGWIWVGVHSFAR